MLKYISIFDQKIVTYDKNVYQFPLPWGERVSERGKQS